MSDEQEKGIKELKEAALALVALGTLSYEMVAQKKFDFGRAMGLIPLLKNGWDGHAELWPELKNLKSAEGVEVLAAVSAELGMIPAKTQAIIVACLGLVGPALKVKEAFELPNEPVVKPVAEAKK